MDELATAGEYPNVGGVTQGSLGPEEDQISCGELVPRDPNTHLKLFSSAPGEVNTKFRKYLFDKSGAIHALLSLPAEPVRGAQETLSIVYQPGLFIVTHCA